MNGLVPHNAVVADIRALTSSVQSLTLKTKLPFSYMPGQFIMVTRYGHGELAAAITSVPRSWSAVRKKEKENKNIHTTESFEISAEGPFFNCPIGTVLGIRGPFGSAINPNNLTGKNLLFFASGPDSAALFPLIRCAAERCSDFSQVTIYTESEFSGEYLFKKDIPAWDSCPNIKTVRIAHRTDPADTAERIYSSMNALRINPERTVCFTAMPKEKTLPVIHIISGKFIKPENIYVHVRKQMHCAAGICGQCKTGSIHTCTDGPITQLSLLPEMRK